MAFRPNPNDILEIDGVEYSVAEHTAAPGMPYGQEGRAATVYKVVAKEEGEQRALKVFKRRYQVPALVSLAHKLETFAEIPGLEVCKRQVITARRHTQLVRQHPDLAFAVLMPWIEGPTWMEVLLEGRELSPEQSLTLARSFVEVLSDMEERGLAHCDLSGPNILLPMLGANYGKGISAPVELVDVEQLYGPGLDRPEAVPAGSSGYAHQISSSGVWHATGDRFAGALIVAEMLCWCDGRVREAAWGESYFDPEEMQQEGSYRYGLLLGVLQGRWGEAAARLFEQAWSSDSLQDCPTISAWLTALPDEPADDIFSGQVVPQVISLPIPKPVPVSAPLSAPIPVPAPAPMQEAVASTPPTPSITSTVDMTGKVKSLLDDAKAFEKLGNMVEALGNYKEALSLLQPGSSAYGELSLIVSKMEQERGESYTVIFTSPEVPEKRGVSAQETGVVVKQAALADGVQTRKRNSATFLVPVLLIVVLLVFGGIAVTMLGGKSNSAGEGQKTPEALDFLLATAHVEETSEARVSQTAQAQVHAQQTTQARAQVLSTSVPPDVGATAQVQETSQALALSNQTAQAQVVAQQTVQAQVQETSQAQAIANQTAQVQQTAQALVVAQQTSQTLALAQKTAQAQLQVPPTRIPPDVGATAQAHANQTVAAQAVATVKQATAIVQAQANQTAAAIAKVANQTKTAVAQAAAQAITAAKQTAAAAATVQQSAANEQKTAAALALATQVRATALAQPPPTSLPAQPVGTLLHTFSWKGDQVWGLAFSPDGQTLASGSIDATIKLWKVSDGKLLRTLTGHKDVIMSLAFSPDGQILASGSGDDTIKLWNVSDGKQLRTLSSNRTFSPLTVAFSRDGQTLASANLDDAVIQLWKVSDGTLLKSLDDAQIVSGVAFSPDGQTLADGGDRNNIVFWDLETGNTLRTLTGHAAPVIRVAFSPDGQTLASGSADKTVRLWKVSDGTQLRTLSGHTDQVYDVAFSPDGQTLASGSADKTIRLWRVSDGTELSTLIGHGEAVTNVAFSPDGQTLASVGSDLGNQTSTIKVWKVK